MIKVKSIFMHLKIKKRGGGGGGGAAPVTFIFFSYFPKWHVIKGIQHKKISSVKFESLLKSK